MGENGEWRRMRKIERENKIRTSEMESEEWLGHKEHESCNGCSPQGKYDV